MPPSVSEILGHEPELTIAIRAAFAAGRIPPEKIANAVRARYIARTLRVLRSRPVPDAPALFFTIDSNIFNVALADVKTQIKNDWAAEAAPVINLNAYSVVRIVKNLYSASTPLLGICVPGGHRVTPDIVCGLPASRLYPVSGAQNTRPQQIENFLENYSICLRQDAAKVFNHLCICHNHRTLTCAACNTQYSSLELNMSTLISWHATGCVECQTRDWLGTKKPPKCSPSQVKHWLVTTRQFVKVL